MTQEEVIKEFKKLGKKSKAEFDKKIIPTKLSNYGVKTGELRAIAKNEAKSDDFLSFDRLESYDLELVINLAMCYTKRSMEEKINWLKKSFEICDNWAIVDTTTLTLKPKEKEIAKSIETIESCYDSPFTFVRRFYYVFLLCYLVKKDYLQYIFDHCRDDNEYYVLMAEAWLLSICYTRFPERTFDFITKSNFSIQMRRMIVRKVLDSYTINEIYKRKIREILD